MNPGSPQRQQQQQQHQQPSSKLHQAHQQPAQLPGLAPGAVPTADAGGPAAAQQQPAVIVEEGRYYISSKARIQKRLGRVLACGTTEPLHIAPDDTGARLQILDPELRAQQQWQVTQVSGECKQGAHT